MGKKIQGAKLRAFKRSKVALEELQERQAEEAVSDDLFVVDRTGATFVPQHLRPSSKVHKAATSASNNAKKFTRTHLSSIDEQKVQRLLLQKHRKGTAVNAPSTSPRRTTPRTTTSFNLWSEEEESPSTLAVLEAPVLTLTTSTTTTTATPSSSSSTSTSIVPRTVKLTAEGIRNVVVSTATAIKDSLWNRWMAPPTVPPGGIAPVHVVTKALPASIAHKIKRPVRTRVVGTTTHVIPFEPKKVVIDTSLTAGQSYHPDPVQHEKLLNAAIQMEVARQQALDQARTPISTGLSQETRALLTKDDSDDDDDDDDDVGEGMNQEGTSMAVGDIPKRLNKLTTAQRNKQKLRRQQEAILKKQKEAKKNLNDGEIPKYQKDIKRQQQLSLQRQLQKIQQQQTKIESNPLGAKCEMVQSRLNPILAPTLPIALRSSASLRTIQPKGSMITDRAYSISARHPSVTPVIPTKLVVPKETTTTRRPHAMVAATTKLAPHKHRKKRKLSLKGKRNSSTRGEDFEILG